MNTSRTTGLPRSRLIFALVLILFVTQACALFSPRKQAATQLAPAVVDPGPTPAPSATVDVAETPAPTIPPLPPTPPPNEAGDPPQPQMTDDLARSFPIGPDTRLDESSVYGSLADGDGAFRLESQAPVKELARFYQQELEQQGWLLRYVDANIFGGVTMHWKKDDVYLLLDFSYDEQALNVLANYQRVDSSATQRLPQDLPLPRYAELVSASETSWEFYINDDFSAVVDFYQQALAALPWMPKPGSGGTQGECTGDCSSSLDLPSGAIPLPTPTRDPRQSKQMAFTLPDDNEIRLNIVPHQSGARLYVDLTLKTVESSGLPSDIPLYPDAADLMVVPGFISYQVSADLKTVKNFFLKELPAAGWKANGEGLDIPPSYMQDWSKNSQQLTLMLTEIDTKTCMVMVTCTNCGE